MSAERPYNTVNTRRTFKCRRGQEGFQIEGSKYHRYIRNDKLKRKLKLHDGIVVGPRPNLPLTVIAKVEQALNSLKIISFTLLYGAPSGILHVNQNMLSVQKMAVRK